MGALASRHDIPLADSIAPMYSVRLDNATVFHSGIVLSFGCRQSRQYDHYYRVMAKCGFLRGRSTARARDEASWRRQRASEEILRCIEKVSNRNFKICTGRRKHHLLHRQRSADGTGSLSPICHWLLREGLCRTKRKMDDPVRRRQGGLRRDFSEAEIRWVRRPIMVECCALASTPQEVAVNARRNREFLERALPAS